MQTLTTILLLLVCTISSVAQAPSLRLKLDLPGMQDSTFGFALERLRDQASTVLSGAFTDTLSIEGARLISRGLADGFLFCADDDLRPRWTKQFGGLGYDAITCMAALPDGGLVVGMICGAGVDGITSYRIVEQTFSGRGGADAVVFVINANGSLRWARNDGAINAEYPTTITVLDDSLIIVAGIFVHESRFGPDDVSDSAEISGYVQAIDMSGRHRWVKTIRGKGLEGSSLAAQIDPLHIHTKASGRIDVVVRASESVQWGDSTLHVSPFVDHRTVAILHADGAGIPSGLDLVESCAVDKATFGSVAGSIGSATAENVDDACTSLPFDVVAWREDALSTTASRIAVPNAVVHNIHAGTHGPLISGASSAQPMLLSLDNQGVERWRYTYAASNGAMYDAVEYQSSIVGLVVADTMSLLLLDVASGVREDFSGSAGEDLSGNAANAKNTGTAKHIIIYYEEARRLSNSGYQFIAITGAMITDGGSPFGFEPVSPQLYVLTHPKLPPMLVLLLP